ncbi:MAG: hypothetical protein IKI57_04405 [Clostridia bacterium]|nr:hypothetical protein [Clostridia bacterium]
MKNIKGIKSIIMFFIILSLFCFNISYADTPTVSKDALSETISSGSSYSFRCEETGVYQVYLMDGADYCENWSLTCGGQDVRLAAIGMQDSDGEHYYEVISPLGTSSSTLVYVVLQKGKTYTVTGSGSGNLNLTAVYNGKYSIEEFKQSEYSSRIVTDKSTTSTEPGGNLESVGDGLDIPSDARVSVKRTVIPQKTDDEFQAAFARLLIAVGDFMMKLLSDIFGDNVTVSNLIFNNVKSVNPNFFKEENVSMGIGGVEIKETVQGWYERFRGIAIAIYMIVIFSIGIRVLLNSTAQGITQARELFVEWLKGFLYLLFMPYMIYFLFEINDSLIQMVLDAINGNSYITGSALTDGTEWSAEAVEFRSPEYVSKYTGMMGYGTDDSNNYYIKKVNDYATNFDLIRIARAYAGATQRISYVFIWYVLIGQLLTFIYIYYKRYFMILFFIAIFPIICIFQAVGIMKDGKARAVSGWLGELISNIFTQFIHAIVYTIVTSIVVDVLYDGIVNGELINWIIIIVAINFVPKGEEIVRKILRALSSGSAEGLGEHGLQKGVHALTAGFKNVVKG